MDFMLSEHTCHLMFIFVIQIKRDIDKLEHLGETTPWIFLVNGVRGEMSEETR